LCYLGRDNFYITNVGHLLLIPNRKYYSNGDEKFVIISFEISYRYKYLNRKGHLLENADKVLYTGLEGEFYVYFPQ
jgi:hypothetical protein